MTAASPGTSTPGCGVPTGAHAMTLSPSLSSPARSTEKKLRPGTVASAGAGQTEFNFQRLTPSPEPEPRGVQCFGGFARQGAQRKGHSNQLLLPLGKRLQQGRILAIVPGRLLSEGCREPLLRQIQGRRIDGQLACVGLLCIGRHRTGGAGQALRALESAERLCFSAACAVAVPRPLARFLRAESRCHIRGFLGVGHRLERCGLQPDLLDLRRRQAHALAGILVLAVRRGRRTGRWFSSAGAPASGGLSDWQALKAASAIHSSNIFIFIENPWTWPWALASRRRALCRARRRPESAPICTG